MRTADRMIAREWSFPLGDDENRGFMQDVADDLRNTTDRSPVVVADNVSRYIQERNPAICLEDYPSLAPPWERFWIEYGSSSGLQRRGVWIEDVTERADQAVDDELPDDGRHVGQLAARAKRDAAMNGAEPDDVRWVIAFVLMVEQDRRVWGPAGILCLALDAHGQVLGNRWSVAPVTAMYGRATSVIEGPKLTDPGPDLQLPTLEAVKAMAPDEREALLAHLREHKDALNGHISRLDARVRDLKGAASSINFLQGFADDNDGSVWLIRALAPALQTLAFLHCRNVELQRVKPPDRVQRRRCANRKAPLVNYHTLHIDVPRFAAGGKGAGGRSLSSLHIVAGHFSHYGACCPNHEPHGLLFGRLTGVYWMPSHARGNPGAGETRTDFEVREVRA